MVNIRKAKRNDLPSLVCLFNDDVLGKEREGDEINISEKYSEAFSEIEADKNNLLIVAENNGVIVGMLQLTFIRYLTYEGGKRAQIEGVRVSSEFRGKGIGRSMMEWAIVKARESHCHLVQLTTDKRRTEALKFYMKLGFVASHEGLKFYL